MESDRRALIQKLRLSRKIFKGKKESRFIKSLFKILDDGKYHEIIRWSEDGLVFEVINEDRLGEILHLFEVCNTPMQFYEKLEECQFERVFEEDPSELKFEHIQYNRDNRSNERKSRKRVKFSEESDVNTSQNERINDGTIDIKLLMLQRYDKELEVQTRTTMEFIRAQSKTLESEISILEKIKRSISLIIEAQARSDQR